jgi:hypothetical protein
LAHTHTHTDRETHRERRRERDRERHKTRTETEARTRDRETNRETRRERDTEAQRHRHTHLAVVGERLEVECPEPQLVLQLRHEQHPVREQRAHGGRHCMEHERELVAAWREGAEKVQVQRR